MAVAFIVCKRVVNNQEHNAFYVGTVLEDGFIYFNDDIKFRVREDFSNPQMFYYPKQIWVNTNLIRDMNGVNFSPTEGGGSVAGNKDVEASVQWALNIAADDSHGYDQTNRDGPNYDCSSLVWHAFTEGGGFSLGGSAFSTRTMDQILTSNGFTRHSFNGLSELQRGDILWRSGHTEIYIGNQQNVGAHSNEFGGVTGGRTGDQTGNEISITSSGTNWTNYYRWEQA